MAGALVTAGGGGGRRSLDSDINMVPMIDLLLVTIAFLLVTAVWTQSAKLNAPSDGTQPREEPGVSESSPDERLEVDAKDPSHFVLRWMSGGTTVVAEDLPRRHVRSDDAAALGKMTDRLWREHGLHKAPEDGARDRAFLSVANDATYDEIVSFMDGIYSVSRSFTAGGGARPASAFVTTLSSR